MEINTKSCEFEDALQLLKAQTEYYENLLSTQREKFTTLLYIFISTTTFLLIF